MCIPFPEELEKLLKADEQNLQIYVCKKCHERSLSINGTISIKALQPDGWGCSCTGTEFELIEVGTIGKMQ